MAGVETINVNGTWRTGLFPDSIFLDSSVRRSGAQDPTTSLRLFSLGFLLDSVLGSKS